MKENSRFHNFYLNGLVILALLAGLFNAYWSYSSLSFKSQESLDLKYLILNDFTGLTAVPLIILVLFMGYEFIAQNKRFYLAVKYWLYMVLFSLIATFAVLLVTTRFSYRWLYDCLFPISRNALPLVTGIVAGCLTVRPLVKYFSQRKELAWTILTLVLTLPLIFNKDIFDFNNGNSFFFGWLVFVAGGMVASNAEELNGKQLVKKALLWWAIYALVMAIWPLFSIHSLNANTMRFSTAPNIFAVLAGIYSFRCWLAYGGREKQMPALMQYTILGTLILISSNDMISALTAFNGQRVFLGAAASAVGMTILTALINWIASKLKLNSRINSWVKRNFSSLNADNIWPWAKQSWRKTWNWIKGHKESIGALLWLYVITYISMVSVGTNFKIHPDMNTARSAFTYVMFQRQQIMIFNWLFFVAMFIIVLGLFDRYWLALLSTTMVAIVWLTANKLKIISRNEPILPSEVKQVSAYGDLLGMVPAAVLWTAVIALVVLAVVIVVLEIKKPGRKLTWKSRLVCLILGLGFFGLTPFYNHSSWVKGFTYGMGDYPQFFNQLEGTQTNGPTLQFFNNIDVRIMTQPKGYSKAKIDKIVAKYSRQANKINANRKNILSKQTIIFNLSESFADPNHVKHTELKRNPIPNVKRLAKQNTGGHMFSSGFGGGTANMEYMTLTGFPLGNFSLTLNSPYTQFVSTAKYAPSIANQFPMSVAIHPYNGNFYSRPAVYKRFGIKQFWYLGSKYPIRHQMKIDNSHYLSDQTAYANTLDAINNTNSGQFINLVTMQNHMPYSGDLYRHTKRYAPKEAVDMAAAGGALSNFSMGIHYTDKAVTKFIKQINKIKKPITLVFYGDHLPGLYRNDMTEDAINLHESNYFIYSNKYARQHGARNISGQNYVGPNDFIALAARQTNSKISAYYALLTKVQELVPAQASKTQVSGVENKSGSEQGNYYLNEKGKQIKKLSKKQKQVLKDLQLIQYDVTTGKHYVKNTNFMNCPK